MGRREGLAMGWKPTKEWIEKRNKKMDLLLNQADEHRKEFVQSDDSIKDYLKFMRKFRHYSANNITMIQSQREGALAVAGYKQWQDKGLQVQKGEKAINILSPNISKYYLNEDEEVVYLHSLSKEEKKAAYRNDDVDIKKRVSFSPAPVFDITQTNAKPEDYPDYYPNKPYHAKHDKDLDVNRLYDYMTNVAEERGIEVNSEAVIDGSTAKGVAVHEENRIDLSHRLTDSEKVSVLAHEMAHLAFDHHKDPSINTGQKELEAEMTAFVVSDYLGIDTSENSFPYLSSWSKGLKQLNDHHEIDEDISEVIFSNVKEASSQLIEDIERVNEQEINIDMAEDKVVVKIPFENKLGTEVRMTRGGEVLSSSAQIEDLIEVEEYENYEAFEAVYNRENTNYRHDMTDYAAGVLDKPVDEMTIDERMESFNEVYYEFPTQYPSGEARKEDCPIKPMRKKDRDKPVRLINGVYHSDSKTDQFYLRDDVDVGDATQYLFDDLLQKAEKHVIRDEITGRPLSPSESVYQLGCGDEVMSPAIHEKIFSDEEWYKLYEKDGDSFFYTEIQYDMEVPVQELEDNPTFKNNYKLNGKDIGTLSNLGKILADGGEVDGIDRLDELVKDIYLNNRQDIGYTLYNDFEPVDLKEKYGIEIVHGDSDHDITQDEFER